MKRRLKIVSCLLICVCLTACGMFGNETGSFYNTFTAAGGDEQYKVSGKANVEGALNLIYLSAKESTAIDLTGKLNAIAGDVALVYIDPDEEEQLIFEYDASRKDSLDVNTSIVLQPGDGRIEFRSEKAAFKFDLRFVNVNDDVFDYFAAEEAAAVEADQDVQPERSDWGDRTEDTEHEWAGDLLNETSVTYTDGDNDCAILDTYVDEDTNVNVIVQAKVSTLQENKSMTFTGFDLTFETEDGKELKAVEYQTDEYALRGYQWNNEFVQEIKLPQGANRLIFSHEKGKNYEIVLDIQVRKAA